MVERTQKDGTKKSFPSPMATASYNQYMGGVDRGDQLRGYYHYSIKSRKYYRLLPAPTRIVVTNHLYNSRYISNFLFEVALTNAFVLFKQQHPKVCIKMFQRVLASLLIGDYCSRKSAGRVSYVTRPLQLQHFPQKPSHLTGGRKRGKCTWCRKRGKRSDTQWHCRECNIWLCHTGGADDCFLLHHRRL